MSDKIKKLSEAIRLGATFRPQCRKKLFFAGRSCALGGALEAIGVGDTVEGYIPLVNRFDIQEWPPTLICPACRLYPLGDCISITAHLNDDHRWTREAIADWLEAKGY